MPYEKRVVLNCTKGYAVELDAMVDGFMRDRVALVAVVGVNCAKVEEIIDELVVGYGSDQSRFLLTSSHEGETLQDAIDFARALVLDGPGEVQLIDL